MAITILSSTAVLAAPDTTKEDIGDLLAIFFKINPEPTDTQVHSLAESIGYEPAGLEQVIYSMFGEDVAGFNPSNNDEDEDEDSEYAGAADAPPVFDNDGTDVTATGIEVFSSRNKNARRNTQATSLAMSSSTEEEDDFLLPMSEMDNVQPTDMNVTAGMGDITESSEDNGTDLNDDGVPVDDIQDLADQQALNDDGYMDSNAPVDYLNQNDALNDDGNPLYK